jgi:lipoprotein-anchoring transpeptidase ErfK/SrfK
VDERLIGLLRYGTSVALRSTDLVRGEGCRGGFYAIEPRGFVCNDHAVTLTPSQRLVDAAAAVAVGPGPLPFRYAWSDGAPMYNRIPTAAEQARAERGLGPAGGKRKPFGKRRNGYQDRAELDPIEPTDPVPPFLLGGAMIADGRQGLVNQPIPPASMLSFTKAFAAEGRTFLLSADHSIVPADRVRIFKPSSFHGTRLGGDVQLPLAWMRATAKPQHRRSAAGAFEMTGGTWPAKGFVRLTGVSADEGRTHYLETMDHDDTGATLWIAEKDATVVEAAKRPANGVKPGQKWIVVSITNGTLVAYEGMTPVFATLMSPGRGGVPIKGHDNVQDSTTPLGTYNITFKDKVSTMSPDKPGEPRTQWIADVPHTQYFDPPFALHAAYWHDRFGEPTSAGCINVSPLDAELLFQWSDPPVPEEWQGATGAGAPENGPMTAIVIRR